MGGFCRTFAYTETHPIAFLEIALTKPHALNRVRTLGFPKILDAILGSHE